MASYYKDSDTGIDFSLNHDHTEDMGELDIVRRLSDHELEFVLQSDVFDMMNDREISGYIQFVVSVNTKTAEHYVDAWNVDVDYVEGMTDEDTRENDELFGKAEDELYPVASDIMETLKVTMPE